MYTEIVVDDTHYFITTRVMEGQTFDVSTNSGKRQLMLMSDFVVQNQRVIKCRHDLAFVVRGFCNARKTEQVIGTFS